MLLQAITHCLDLLIRCLITCLNYLQRSLQAVNTRPKDALTLVHEDQPRREQPVPTSDSAPHDDPESSAIESRSSDAPVIDTSTGSPDAQAAGFPSAVDAAAESSPETVDAAAVWKPRAFALIVAIDEYQHSSINNLSGCVRDAEDFRDFTVKTRGVPETQIYTLTNGEATRDAILNAIYAKLIDNPDIRKDDLIMFYYAGHGARRPAPASWVADGREIETICPCDERMTDSKSGERIEAEDR